MKFVPILLVFFTSSAFAVKLDFSFNVNSSGPSIYPCDAGIKHVTHVEEICYDRTTQNSCDPTLCEAGEECNCVCSGGNNPQDNIHTQDFMSVVHADWADNGMPLPTVSSSAVTASETDFSRIFSGKTEWDKQLSSLTFNLGSERYGTEFYLDVCYRGPQINFNGNAASNKYAMRLQSTITDLISVNGLQYSSLADLKVKITASCDLQGEGDFTGPATDDAQSHQITDVSGGDKNFSTAFSAFNGGANVAILNDWINNSANKAPRFCKIRYTFFENMRNNAASPLSQIRQWRKQESRISTFSEIASKREL